MPKATRAAVYAAIDRERDYQDGKYPAQPVSFDPSENISASPEGFLLVAEQLLADARAKITAGHLPPLGDGSVAMDAMLAANRRMAAERKGKPYTPSPAQLASGRAVGLSRRGQKQRPEVVAQRIATRQRNRACAP